MPDYVRQYVHQVAGTRYYFRVELSQHKRLVPIIQSSLLIVPLAMGKGQTVFTFQIRFVHFQLFHVVGIIYAIIFGVFRGALASVAFSVFLCSTTVHPNANRLK